jgi:large subunit ribosomal protein L4
MADAPVLGSPAKKVKLDEAAFSQRFHEPLVHQSVRAEQAARRRGTAATKTRGMVSGGGAKPWRQKGTGRARAGSNRSPIWTGGGITFGPQPRSYTFKVNRKEQRAALRSALSLHAQRSSIALVDTAAFSAPKTRQARELLEDWGQPGPTLVVLDADERDAALSFRNLDRVAVLTHESVGIADLLRAASLVISQAALDALTARATGEKADAQASTAPQPVAKAKKAPAKKAAPKAVTEAPAEADEAAEPVAEDSAEEPAEAKERAAETADAEEAS